MDKGDALDYPMLYEKALAEIERLREHPTWDGYVAQQCATLLQENEGLRAEIERLQLVIQSEMTPTEIAQQLAECNVLADAYAEQNVTIKELRAKNEQLRDTLDQAVDDFGEGHCVCEQTKQQCIDALKEGD